MSDRREDGPPEAITGEPEPLPALQPLACVRERDVDLLLLEELCVDDAFRRWFAERALGAGANAAAGAFRGAWQSVSEAGLGESDLVVDFDGPDGRGLRLLVENKIDAPFQPDQ